MCMYMCSHMYTHLNSCIHASTYLCVRACVYVGSSTVCGHFETRASLSNLIKADRSKIACYWIWLKRQLSPRQPSPLVWFVLWGFHVSLKAVNEMMLNQMDTNDDDFDVACRWILSNEDRWTAWIPEKGTCFSQFGMYSVPCQIYEIWKISVHVSFALTWGMVAAFFKSRKRYIFLWSPEPKIYVSFLGSLWSRMRGSKPTLGIYTCDLLLLRDGNQISKTIWCVPTFQTMHSLVFMVWSTSGEWQELPAEPSGYLNHMQGLSFRPISKHRVVKLIAQLGRV